MTLADLLDEFNVVIDTAEGLTELRSLILGLAVRGKLVPQDPNNNPVSNLLAKIEADTQKLYEEGYIRKPKNLKPVSKGEQFFSIPKSWSWVRLNSATTYIQRGKSPKYQGGSGVYVINQKCVRWHGVELEHAKEIKPESLDSHEEKRFIQPGDILWNSTGTGTIGRLAIASGNEIGLTVDSHVTLVRPRRLIPKYIWCWLAGKEVYGEIENDASGSTNQIELTKTYALNLPTPLPPLAEQTRIVQKIESLFAEVDELEAKLNRQIKLDAKLQLAVNAEVRQAPESEDSESVWNFITRNFDTLYHTPVAIDNLKQNILSAAVRGRLTTQNPNDERVSELLAKIEADTQKLYEEDYIRKPKSLKPVSKKEQFFSIPESWKWVRLNSLTTYIQRGKSPKYQDGSNVYVINQKCVRWHGIELEYAKEINPKSLESHEKKRFIQAGDILWNSTGTGTIGRLTIASDNEVGLTVDSHVTLVRTSRVLPKYIWCWLAGMEVYGEIENDASGSTNQIELTKTYALNLPIPLPPLEEQHRIVQRIEELFAICDRFKAQLEQRQKVNERLIKGLVQEVLEKAGSLEKEKILGNEISIAAEPLEEYQSSEEARILPFKSSRIVKPKIYSVSNIHKTDLQAAVTTRILVLYDKSTNRKPHLGRTKLEKTNHVIESHIGCDFGRKPLRMARGAADFDRMINKVEPRAEKLGWFNAREIGNKVHYTKGTRYYDAYTKTNELLSKEIGEIDRIINLFLLLSTKKAEIYETVYAAWHDLLAYGFQPNDKEIVIQSSTKEYWTVEKEAIPQEKFYKAINWLRKNNLVPDGTGKLTKPIN